MEIQLFTSRTELQHLVQNLSKYDSTVLGVLDTKKGIATISSDKNLIRKYMELRHPQVFDPKRGTACADLWFEHLWSNEEDN